MYIFSLSYFIQCKVLLIHSRIQIQSSKLKFKFLVLNARGPKYYKYIYLKIQIGILICNCLYMHPFLLTFYVFFLLWVVVLMEKTKCMEKYVDHFPIVEAVPIQDHILFAKDHSNSSWTKVITFVGPLYNLDVVFFSCPWPKTNIFFYLRVTILVNDVRSLM